MNYRYIPIQIDIWISQVLFFILFCLSCSIIGQESKKLEVKDYDKWETVLPNKLPYNGKWVSFGVSKTNHPYKIVVQNIETNKSFKIDSCYLNSFTPKGNWFFALDWNKNLIEIDLRSQTKQVKKDVQNYQLSPFKEHVAYIQGDNLGNNNVLIIKDLVNVKFKSFKNVIHYEFSPNGNEIAFIKKQKQFNKVIVFNLKSWKILSIKNTSCYTAKLKWQKNSKGLAFWESNKLQNEMFWWTDTMDSLKVKKFGVVQKRYSVTNLYRIPFKFSNDDNKLFFQIEKIDEQPYTSKRPSQLNVEIWNTKDEFVYPAAKSIEKYYPKTSYTVLWSVENDTSKILSTKHNPITLIGNNGQYAYSYSSKENIMATWDKDVPSQIILYNHSLNTQKEILENKYSLNSTVSPSGRYLTYFKKSHWYIYDAKLDTHTNLTSQLQNSFAKQSNYQIPSSPYGSPLWTENENEVVFYDEWDIWMVTPDGLKASRITKGRETNQRYRFHLATDNFVLKTQYNPRHSSRTLNLTTGAILKVRNVDNGDTGYMTYSKKEGIKPIVEDNALHTNLRLSGDKKSIVYLREEYDKPPKLISQNLNTGTKNTVYQSNSHHFMYQWGREELVSYKTENGEYLKGILYYPANFNPSRKYPMIVSIYENQSKNYHKYHNPTLNDRIGFSISNFTTNDYFVFLPDIVYELGNPGISAHRCVMAGLDEVTKKPYIDPTKIGLYGHSFGGYESMFILTQTDRFATVVAGAGASNLLSFYLSMAWIWDRPQYTRFERQQWRMGNSYFNIPKAYQRNSPINYASNITTPLLSWAGKNDSNVNWEQHVEFYLALRKLEKEHIMLLYPDEGHDISKPFNQVDLTLKIMDWYDSHLKGLKPPAWMSSLN